MYIGRHGLNIRRRGHHGTRTILSLSLPPRPWPRGCTRGSQPDRDQDRCQAYEAGKWRTFETVRARKRARFSTRYRFTRATSGASFLIRARIRRDDSYPYYLGYSPRVRVRVR